MDETMDVENQNAVGEVENQNASVSSSSTADASPPENHEDILTHHPPRLGTIIPNRIFVGGIDVKVNESNLRQVFSSHGAVKEVKIVQDRTGMSKGYGFVTFENQDDAVKILQDANGISFKDKKLNIGQAFRKQQTSAVKRVPLAGLDYAVPPPPMSCGMLQQTTTTGYVHNGVAYYHCPNMSHPPHLWPVGSHRYHSHRAAPPVMFPQSHQPVYQQPAYHHYQCVPNQYQWNVIQPPMPSGPVVFSQPPEYLYQPADGGSAQPPLPVMEDTAEEFMDPALLQAYPVYPQRTEGMTPVLLQHDPGKNQMFPHSQVYPKPNYFRYLPHKDCQQLQEATEPPDAFVPKPADGLSRDLHHNHSCQFSHPSP